jgi:outer membrane phospholipase A
VFGYTIENQVRHYLRVFCGWGSMLLERGPEARELAGVDGYLSQILTF